ncbi:MAG: hypothetical protein IPP87_09110 [Ideonella sp.]|jgi:hypothetical protein|nr:hypothetical protein [Ideonella sp.]MBL0148851.1 hypothetical protein [Ideonella sp.]
MNTRHITTATCLLALLSAVAADASAATIRVQCEQRGTQRAQVSVDAKGLVSGQSYSAAVVSGGNSAMAAPQRAAGGEVQFDFDSNPGDIAAGATAITATFITGGSVTGKVLAADGSTLIADTVACRVRNR